MILPLVAEVFGRVGREPAVEEAFDSLRRKPREFRLAGLTDLAKSLLAVLSAKALGRPVVLLAESNERAEVFLESVQYFYRAVTNQPARRVAFLPAFDVLPWEAQSPHPEISSARAIALSDIAAGDAEIVIAPLEAALLRLHPADFYARLARSLEKDQEVPLEEFLSYLQFAGYERRDSVEMPGQFAQRGGIVDVFSPAARRPFRIELLGDQIESLREFDPETQRSTAPVGRLTILPLTDVPRETLAEPSDEFLEDSPLVAGFAPGWEFHPARFREATASLLDLIPEPVVLLDEPDVLESAEGEFRKRLEAARGGGAGEGASSDVFFLREAEWGALLERRARLGLEHLPVTRQGIPLHEIRSQPTTRYHGDVAAFMAEVKARTAARQQVFACAASTGELERLADLCHEFEVPYRLGELEESTTLTRLAEEGTGSSVPALVLLKAPFAEGVGFPDSRFSLYGNTDVFEASAPRPRARPKTAVFSSDFSDLKPGDFVVHVDHGIGRFEGLRQVAVDGMAGEFMLLHYAEEARLYVPLARLDLVQKYQSLGGATPALDHLGAGSWDTRKSKVRKSVSDLADKLLALYAERKAAEGHAYPPDSGWQKEFEDAFEFEETTDQARAIEDVKKDLQSSLPMDRLLCGDVGYGKTEVAMRAAFKVVGEGKQVAVLAPTTVLAFQHFRTFRSRFAAFPFNIEMLSRFVSARDQKSVIERLEAGKVDIVIGTHRLLSRDLVFHDLGLLIVDEEQRFGVAHKERIKEMRHNVDVLTMSATPIPRTLHMSLAGMRDMSVIETPPRGRLAIQTIVAPFQEGVVQRAIEHELARGGQVFFVHNRVESIASIASLVKRLVPKARVVVGHGQMRESEIEKVMMKFVRGEADVLVSTTIIENGLDISRANTIIINRADRLGLSELYQLRGRVGRSDQRAYAYLLIPPEASLAGLARQRLAALKEFSDLGAGFRIAALDLELRGAGNLLGREQHGHVAAVGFDMYCRMLERAVAERKGEAVRPELRVTLNLHLDIRIPASYIESENLRLRMYKRIAAVATDTERDELRRELDDRFGPAPGGVANLLEYAVIKAMAEKLLIASIERRGEDLAFRFHPETPLRPEVLVRTIRRERGLRLDPSGVLWVNWKQRGGDILAAARNLLLQLQA